MKRPRRKGAQPSSPESGTSPADNSAEPSTGRRVRVRSRLVVAVAVVAATVAGAGSWGVTGAAHDLDDAQDLVALSERTASALGLAHALADERDEATARAAAGEERSTPPEGGEGGAADARAPGASASHAAAVDRRVDELREDATGSLRSTLDGIAGARRTAAAPSANALEVHRAYSTRIAELHALAERLAERMPAAAPGGSHALADLDTAVQQTSAARGLLVAALSVPRGEKVSTLDPVTGLTRTSYQESPGDRTLRRELVTAAQQARSRAAAALAEFHDTAPAGAIRAYDSAVTGPTASAAEDRLTGLTDASTLSDAELALEAGQVGRTLAAYTDLMRGAESSLNVGRTGDLAELRDDAVTELELRAALIGLCLLLAVGFLMATFRTLTRPLAVLRLGSSRLAADPGVGEPVRFTGRNDEFAQVVAGVNTLHAHVTSLREKLDSTEAERKHLIGQRKMLADQREELRTALAEASEQIREALEAESRLRARLAPLTARALEPVDRQLALIERLEEREGDPDRLATLFKLDHLATLVRRHGENLLTFTGAEPGHCPPGPVALVDVVRAAISEIEAYDRVRIGALPTGAHVIAGAADDLSHLLAELLENAATHSPPDAPVELSAWMLPSGELMLSVQDEGTGLGPAQLKQLNARLEADTRSEAAEPGATGGPEDGTSGGPGGPGVGLYVAARLARPHGISLQLREQNHAGTTAVAVLPLAVLAEPPAAAGGLPDVSEGPVPPVRLPGSEAEANSNALYGRSLPQRGPSRVGADEPAEAGPQPDGTPEPTPTAEEPGAEEPAAPEPSQPELGGAVPGPRKPSGLDGPPEPEASEETADAHREGRHEGHPDAEDETEDETEDESEDQAENETEEEAEEGAEPLTGKGLPKRTPRLTRPSPAAPSRPTGVNAEELRRRLGGFRRGSLAGRREADTETTDPAGPVDPGSEATARPATADGRPGTGSPEAHPAAPADPTTARAEPSPGSGDASATVAAGSGRSTATAAGDRVEEATS